MRLIAKGPSISVTLRPASICVNPVFEISHALPRLQQVSLDESRLPSERYAWDGKTLWLDNTFRDPTKLQLDFSK